MSVRFCRIATAARCFIDQIGRMSPLPVQERLLDWLRRGAVRPIGAQHSFRVDLRLITASDLPLGDLVAAGAFLPELHEAIALSLRHAAARSVPEAGDVAATFAPGC